MSIIRPTGVYNVGLINPAYIYDGSTGSAATVITPNSALVASVGASGTEATSAWGTGAYGNLGAATLNVNFLRTASSNDTAWIEYGYMSGSTYTRIGYLYGPATGAAQSQHTVSAALSEANFGNFFANLTNLRVRIGGTKVGGGDDATLYIVEVWLDVAEFNLTGTITTTTPKITGSFTPGRQLVGTIPKLTASMSATQENVPVPSSSLDVRIPATGASADITNFPLKVQVTRYSGVGYVNVSSVMSALLLGTPQQIHAYQGETSLYIDLVLWDQANARAIMYVLVPTLYAAQETLITVVFDESLPTNPLLSESWATDNPTALVWGGLTSNFLLSADKDILSTTGLKNLHNRVNGSNTLGHIDNHSGVVTWNEKVGYYITALGANQNIDLPFPAGAEDWDAGFTVKIPTSTSTYILFCYTTSTGHVYVRVRRQSTGYYEVHTYGGGTYNANMFTMNETSDGWISFVVTSRYDAANPSLCNGWVVDSNGNVLLGPVSASIIRSAAAYVPTDVPYDPSLSTGIACTWFNANPDHGVDGNIKRKLMAVSQLDELAAIGIPGHANMRGTIPKLTCKINDAGVWGKQQYYKFQYIPGWLEEAGAASYDYSAGLMHRIVLRASAGRNGVDLTDIFDKLGDDPRHIKITTTLAVEASVDLYADVAYWNAEQKFAIIYFAIPGGWGTTTAITIYLHYDEDRASNPARLRTKFETISYPDTIKEQVYASVKNIYMFDEAPAVGTGPSVKCLRTGHQLTLENGDPSMLKFDPEIGPYWEFNGVDQAFTNPITGTPSSYLYGKVFGLRDSKGTKPLNPICSYDVSLPLESGHQVFAGLTNDETYPGDFTFYDSYAYWQYPNSIFYMDEPVTCSVSDWHGWILFNEYGTDSNRSQLHWEGGFAEMPSLYSSYIDETSIFMRDPKQTPTAFGNWDLFLFIPAHFRIYWNGKPHIHTYMVMDRFWDITASWTSGDIESTTPALTMTGQASFEMVELPDAVMAVWVPVPRSEMHAGCHMGTSIPPMTAAMIPGVAMAGILPKLRIMIYEGEPNHGNLSGSIHPPSTCEMYGHHVLAELEARLKPIACRAYSGASMGTRLPRLRISGFTGENGVTAEIDGTIPEMRTEMYVGSLMAMALPGLSAEMSAGNEILGQLQADIPGMLFAGYGDSEVAVVLVSRLRAFSCTMVASGKMPVSMEVAISALRATLHGYPGIVAHLEAQLGAIRGRARGTQRISSLDVEIPPIYMRIDTVSECCSEVLRHTRGAVR